MIDHKCKSESLSRKQGFQKLSQKNQQINYEFSETYDLNMWLISQRKFNQPSTLTIGESYSFKLSCDPVEECDDDNEDAKDLQFLFLLMGYMYQHYYHLEHFIFSKLFTFIITYISRYYYYYVFQLIYIIYNIEFELIYNIYDIGFMNLLLR